MRHEIVMVRSIRGAPDPRPVAEITVAQCETARDVQELMARSPEIFLEVFNRHLRTMAGCEARTLVAGERCTLDDPLGLFENYRKVST